MKTVRIEKSRLITILKANADTHATEFETAFKAWQVKQREKLMFAVAKLGGADADTFEFHKYAMPKPENHSADYARALKQLDLSADEVITLDQNEYAQFVEDEWSWQRAFKGVVGTYSGALATD